MNAHSSLNWSNDYKKGFLGHMFDFLVIIVIVVALYLMFADKIIALVIEYLKINGHL